MRSASSSKPQGETAPPFSLRRWLAHSRERVSFAEAPTVLLVLLLTMVVAQATIIMAWVNHSEVFIPVAFLAVVVMSALALARFVPAFVAMPIFAVGIAVVPWWFNAAALHAAHPTSPFGVPPPDTWPSDIVGTTQTVDTAL